MIEDRSVRDWRACLLGTLTGALLAACGDGPTDPVADRLVVETGPVLELRIGSTHQLQARVLNAAGRTLPDAVISWSTSDTAIAKIDAVGMLRLAFSYTSCGWVAPGECRVQVTARSGGLQAMQTIVVLPYEPIVELNPKLLELEAGQTERIRTRILLELLDVPWCSVSYTARAPHIASVDARTGVVMASDVGRTIVDVAVSGRGCPTATLPVEIVVRPPWHTLSIAPNQSELLVAPGDSLRLTALVRNFKAVVYPALSVQWTSANPAVASIDSDGWVRVAPTAGSCSETPAACRVTITARSGKLVATAVVVVAQR